MSEKNTRLARVTRLLIVATTLGLLPGISLLACQDDPEIAMEEGTIGELRDELNLLLTLAENKDSRLEFDRRGWAGHTLSTEDRKKELTERFGGDGVPAEFIDRMVKRMVSRRKSGFHDLVEKLAKAAHYSGRSGSDEQTVYRAQNLDIVMRANENYQELNLLETTEPNGHSRSATTATGIQGLASWR